MKQIVLNVNTDTNGAGSKKGSAIPAGLLYGIRLVDGSFADGVDVTLTAEEDGFSYLLYTGTNFNTDQMVCPRVPEVDTNGVALGSSALPIIAGEPKAVIAQGGSEKSGSFILYILD